MFLIEDEIHAEHHGQFASLDEAISELRRRATITWDQAPNAAPCTSWKTCGRDYVVVEYDDSQSPWKELRRMPVLRVSASGVEWAAPFVGASNFGGGHDPDNQHS
jgi:hypothetical protein